jgi:uncharacterized protein (DUF488 family)
VSTDPFFTIGHSTRPLDAFVALLRESEVALVADVRTVPRSRANPQFSGERLPESLAAVGIDYQHIAELGGLRGKRRSAEPSPNTFWDNDSFRNYADYALTDGFRVGLATLRRLGQEHRCAIMCAEAVWWRCHRRIIADYLLASGERVVHILGPGHVEPARLTPAAERRPDGTLIYPARSGIEPPLT